MIGLNTQIDEKRVDFFASNTDFIKELIREYQDILNKMSQNVPSPLALETILQSLDLLTFNELPEATYKVFTIYGLITCLKQNLFLEKPLHIERALGILTNLILENNEEMMVRIVLEDGLIEKVFDFCQYQVESLKQKAIFCLSSICQYPKVSIILVLIEKKLLSLFNALLGETNNIKNLQVVLEGITSILYSIQNDAKNSEHFK